jgi:hypothetical protein
MSIVSKYYMSVRFTEFFRMIGDVVVSSPSSSFHSLLFVDYPPIDRRLDPDDLVVSKEENCSRSDDLSITHAS